MRSLLAFIKKEMIEQIRTSKLAVLGLIFVLFGVMNPAVAKLTPWLLETLSDSLAESGMMITAVTVSAMDSWVQFFKNVPMALIVFVLLEGSVFTKEYQSGTLLLSLSKGLDRYKVIVAKASVLFFLWTVGYWLCFGITYAYNAYFWDNAIVQNLLLSVVCWWVFGLWVIALAVLFSVLSKSSTGVLLGTGGVVFGSYFLSIIPKLGEYLPTRLTDGNSLICGVAEADSYAAALIVVGVTGFASCIASIPLFNKKQL